MKLSDILTFLESPDKCQISYDGNTISPEHLILEGTISDSDTAFFVAGHEFGPSHLITVPAYRGDGFDAAWEAWVDSLNPIPKEELIEAYGPEGTPNGSFLDEAHAAARGDGPPHYSPDWPAHIAAIHAAARKALEEYAIDGERYPDLIEGYEQQSNASGTGIVSMGHYASMHEADLSLIEISVPEKV